MSGAVKTVLVGALIVGWSKPVAAVVTIHDEAEVCFVKGKATRGATWSSHFQRTRAGLASPSAKTDEKETPWVQSPKIATGYEWHSPSSLRFELALREAAGEPSSEPSVYLRYGCDGTHWSTWYEMTAAGSPDGREPTYRLNLRLPRVAQAEYVRLRREYRRKSGRAASDLELFRWLAKHHREFFDREIPFMGYVQVRLEFHELKPHVTIRRLNLETWWHFSGAVNTENADHMLRDDFGKPWSFEFLEKRSAGKEKRR